MEPVRFLYLRNFVPNLYYKFQHKIVKSYRNEEILYAVNERHHDYPMLFPLCKMCAVKTM